MPELYLEQLQAERADLIACLDSTRRELSEVRDELGDACATIAQLEAKLAGRRTAL